MDNLRGGDWPGKDQQRILQRLDHMVSTGRITPEEAERLRAAGDADAFQSVMGEVMARHAGPDLDAAVAAGRMTPSEADDLKDRLSRGEHAPGLRRHLRQLVSHRRRPKDAR